MPFFEVVRSRLYVPLAADGCVHGRGHAGERRRCGLVLETAPLHLRRVPTKIPEEQRGLDYDAGPAIQALGGSGFGLSFSGGKLAS